MRRCLSWDPQRLRGPRPAGRFTGARDGPGLLGSSSSLNWDLGEQFLRLPLPSWAALWSSPSSETPHPLPCLPLLIRSQIFLTKEQLQPYGDNLQREWGWPRREVCATQHMASHQQSQPRSHLITEEPPRLARLTKNWPGDSFVWRLCDSWTSRRKGGGKRMLFRSEVKCERNTFPQKQTLDCVQLVCEYQDKARAGALVCHTARLRRRAALQVALSQTHGSEGLECINWNGALHPSPVCSVCSSSAASPVTSHFGSDSEEFDLILGAKTSTAFDLKFKLLICAVILAYPWSRCVKGKRPILREVPAHEAGWALCRRNLSPYALEGPQPATPLPGERGWVRGHQAWVPRSGLVLGAASEAQGLHRARWNGCAHEAAAGDYVTCCLRHMGQNAKLFSSHCQMDFQTIKKR